MAGRNTAGIRRQPSGSAAPRLMLRLPLSRRSALQLAAAGGGAALLAHAAPAAHGQGPSGEMIVAPPAQIVALDPHGAQSVEEVMHTALQHVMEPLVKRDPASGDLAPHLATEWSNPDETTWRFTLREGVQFHDGSPFTSEDVKASLERVIEEAGPLAPLFAQVDAIATPDETTVEIRTTSPVGTIAVSMTMVQIAPAESQFLDTQNFTSVEVCRMVGPGVAEMLGYETGGRMMYQNVQSRSLHLLIYTIDKWLKGFEDCVTELFLPRSQSIEFDRQGVMRMVPQDRWQVHREELTLAAKTINEVRAEEGLEPVEWGDKPYLPTFGTTGTAAAESLQLDAMDAELDGKLGTIKIKPPAAPKIGGTTS